MSKDKKPWALYYYYRNNLCIWYIWNFLKIKGKHRISGMGGGLNHPKILQTNPPWSLFLVLLVAIRWGVVSPIHPLRGCQPPLCSPFLKLLSFQIIYVLSSKCLGSAIYYIFLAGNRIQVPGNPAGQQQDGADTPVNHVAVLIICWYSNLYWLLIWMNFYLFWKEQVL